MSILKVKHSGHLGDIIYSLPAALKLMKLNDKKFIDLYIPKGKKYHAPQGQHHICGDVWITDAMFNFISPLLLNLEYINSVEFIEELLIPKDAYDFDAFRSESMLNLASGNIVDYYFKTFGLLGSNPDRWLNCRESLIDTTLRFDIVIGRSTRYNNINIDYSLLGAFSSLIGFLGTDREYFEFKNQFSNLNIQHLNVDNAFKAMLYILNSDVYIGNQSFFFSIAEGLKVKRLLEVCEICPNVIPNGGTWGQFLTTRNLGKLLSQVLDKKINLEKIPFVHPQYILGKPI